MSVCYLCFVLYFVCSFSKTFAFLKENKRGPGLTSIIVSDFRRLLVSAAY